MYLKLLGAAALAAVAGGAWAQSPPPVSAFARLPAVTQAKISPNGQRIAILGGAPNDRTISFTVIDQPGASLLHLGDVETMSIRWAGDAYAVARYAQWEKVGARNAYRFERNVAVRPDGKVASFLLKSDQISAYLVSQPYFGTVEGPPVRSIVYGLTLAAGPDHDINTRLGRKGGDGNPLIPALFSVDPETGKGVQIEKGDYDTVDFDIDLQGQARVKIVRDQLTDKYRVFGRGKGATTWTLVQNGRDDAVDFLGYADADDSIYFGNDTAEGTQVLRKILATGATEPVGKPVAGDPWTLWDEYRSSLVAVGSAGAADTVQWLDPDFAAVYGPLARAFKGKSVSIVSWSKDRSRVLAEVEGRDAPSTFYLFDRARKELSPVGEAYPELAGASLGKTTWITYKASDGLEIPAYLTLPPGAPAAGGKLPLVVLPHGGPQARDGDGFDWLAHFLATRGYAVLRPQYRGSYGFGLAFTKAGEGEWGGKMQTDLLDGVADLAAKGVIDPKRVCIAGASFGGYSALHAAVFHPQSYRCAIAIAGVSDLGLLLSEKVSSFGADSRSFRSLKDELSKEADGKLSTVSPLKNASKAAIPVLMVHGDQDTVVPLYHSARMAEALTKAGKPVELVTLKDENHYLTKTASRTQVLTVMEAFLAKNLAVSQAP